MEYESRRDADDAYHEMHNKRIGRDDLLKIEVSPLSLPPYQKDYYADVTTVGSHPSVGVLAL